MTNATLTLTSETKKPPQSIFHLRHDDESKVNEIKSDDEEEITFCSKLEETPSKSLSSSSSSPPPKNHNHKQMIHSKLHLATLKVETISQRADDALFQVRDRVIQYTDSIKQTATTIDQQNITELELITQKRLQKKAFAKIEKDKNLKNESNLKAAAKRKEQVLQLENLKVETLNDRLEKRRTLKWLVGREKTKQDEVSPLQILKDENYFTIEDCEEDEDILDEVAIDDINETERNDLNQDDHSESEKRMTIEEMRVAAQSEAAEEIKMAKEFRRHEMAKLAKEREESKYNLEVEEAGCLDETGPGKSRSEKLIAGVQTSTVCKALDCTEEELYDASDPFEPTIEIMKISSGDADIIKQNIIDLIQIIEKLDAKLKDIEIMQSVTLAEIAAFNGKDEFKTGEDQLNIIKDDISFSPTDDIPTQLEPERSKISFESISKRAELTMKTFRLAADKVDRYARMKQRRRG